jgi:hypothetical protein
LFDFDTSEWRDLKNMKEGRWGHAAYVLNYQQQSSLNSPSITSVNTVNTQAPDTKLVVVGGWSKKNKNLQTAEIYDVENNVWQFIAPMNVARSRCVAMEWTTVERFGVIGGWGNSTKIVEFYDCNKDSWYQLSDLNHEHVNPACGLISDQHLYIMNKFLEDPAREIILNRQNFNNSNNGSGNGNGNNGNGNSGDRDRAQSIFSQQSGTSNNTRSTFSRKISSLKGRPAPFVMGSNDQMSCLELFDERLDQWIILQQFEHDSIPMYSMIECALPDGILQSQTSGNRSQRTSVWSRRSSRILGML